MNQEKGVYQAGINSLPLLYRGKVRDVFAVDDEHLLIVASDRLSAFDVVLPSPIPAKGIVLTAISNFWFQRWRDLVPNHLTLARKTLDQALPDAAERENVVQRAVVARKLRALPIEAIVRGYIIGSAWKDYQRDGAVCGIKLPPGLQLADKLPEPVFTPSSKAAAGAHDENISFEAAAHLIGFELAGQVREISLRLYREAAAYAWQKGIIIADTKFEFGLDDNHQLVLMDEAVTPDSSRFWPAERYKPGQNPPSFDKQYVRDYLETLDWDKTAPGPELPPQVIAKTSAIYREAQRRLTA